MRKKDILFKLKKEIKRAEKRQHHNAIKDSGHIRGLKNAIKIIQEHN
ncbi:hypothetical protein [Bacillus thuringiensis]|nr:hypothetical protein [Bacillus thuringiensis]MEB9467874.1 hypothetical protein [Bacillus cereus]MDO6628809.1 hypothetical protein [Bacillus thuringiensis]MDO6659272.1 hypothetical protein [Bacillus thuringiensis]MDO6698854.1 hypothetical protein [Bacillus thuringiensis]MRA82482.1 hypothetical protein [Bacillus thuringiensis]